MYVSVIVLRLQRRSGAALLIALLLQASGFIAANAASAQQKEAVKIGALTNGWGPTPAIVGLRDGLIGLGYREGEQFVIGQAIQEIAGKH